MAHIIAMPRYGANMVEGTIQVWNVEEGDVVSAEDIVGEIAIEKLANELPAGVEGTILKLVGEEGETYECGYPIAIVGEPGEDYSHLLPESEEDEEDEAIDETVVEKVEKHKPVPASNTEVLVSPKAKKMADKSGLDLSTVSGTGIRGRITASDVESAKPISMVINENAKATPKAELLAAELGVDYRYIQFGTGRLGTITRDDVRVFAESNGGNVLETKLIKMTPLQQVIATKMYESMQTTAQVTISREVDMTNAVAFYQANKQAYLDQNLKLSYTVLLIKAIANALVDHPIIRTTLHDSKTFSQSGQVNIGIATDIPDGLVVPNIKSCNVKSLATISAELRDLVDRAQTGRLVENEYMGGTITISNMGMLGISYFTPILNEGESAIIGVGVLEEKVVSKNGGIFVKPTMSISLTHDHRVINGAPAARFLQSIQDYLLKPEEL